MMARMGYRGKPLVREPPARMRAGRPRSIFVFFIIGGEKRGGARSGVFDA